jgi:segregation and condensation protein B
MSDETHHPNDICSSTVDPHQSLFYLSCIEAIFFTSDKPISLQKIRDTLDSQHGLTFYHDLILNLQKRYECPGSGIKLIEVADGWQIRTKPQVAPYIQKAHQLKPLSLGNVPLEILAIIAYKQPISRVQIDELRGVDSSHSIRTLLDKKLIKIIGRSEDWGRPVLYATTQEFLEIFSLNTLQDLPPEFELDTLAQQALPKEIGHFSELLQKESELSPSEISSFPEQDFFESLQSQMDHIQTETVFTKTIQRPHLRSQPMSTLLDFYFIEQDVAASNREASQSISSELFSKELLNDLNDKKFLSSYPNLDPLTLESSSGGEENRVEPQDASEIF